MNKTMLFGMLGLLVVLSAVGIAYAHSDGRLAGGGEGNGFMGVVDTETMDRMHKAVTKNLDPTLKKQMDAMHERCMGTLRSGGGMMG